MILTQPVSKVYTRLSFLNNGRGFVLLIEVTDFFPFPHYNDGTEMGQKKKKNKKQKKKKLSYWINRDRIKRKERNWERNNWVLTSCQVFDNSAISHRLSVSNATLNTSSSLVSLQWIFIQNIFLDLWNGWNSAKEKKKKRGKYESKMK